MIIASIYALLAAAAWGTSDFISLIPSRKVGYYITATFLQTIGFAEVLVYVLVTNPSQMSIFISHPALSVVGILVGVFAYLSILFLLRGFTIGAMSIVSPISATYPVITILLSIAFLGATLEGVQTLGIALLLTGIIMAGIRLSELRKPKPLVSSNQDPSVNLPDIVQSSSVVDKQNSQGSSSNGRIVRGVIPAMGTAICAGLVFFGLGFVTPVFGSLPPVILVKGTATGLSFALLGTFKQKFHIPRNRTIFFLVIIGALDSLGLIFFNLGVLVAGSNLPIVVTISSMGTILTVLLANIFYKERLDKIQYLGIAILLIGLSIVLYFST